jgi:hypothetical protein
MCIICIKPAGTPAPSKEIINNMGESNPDGFGLAYVKNGEVIVRKTMDLKTYTKWVLSLPKETPAILHLRIATHGSVNEKNCHPFLSDDKKVAFAHNGILSITNREDMTDSETYFRDVLEPVRLSGIAVGSPRYDNAVNCVVKGSKFAILEASGNITLYGEWIEDGGYKYSNDTYKPRWNYYQYGGYAGWFNEPYEEELREVMFSARLRPTMDDFEWYYSHFKSMYGKVKKKKFKALFEEILYEVDEWYERYEDDFNNL